MVNAAGATIGIILGAFALGALAACAPLPLPALNLAAASLADHGLAPELINRVWLNTEKPLRLAELRGRVVLVDMWTFG